MAVSGIRVTFVFEVGRHGPTETHVLNVGEVADAIEPAMTLAKARRKIMGAGTRFFAVRLSKEGVFRDSRVFSLEQIAMINSVSLALTGSNAGITDNSTDQAAACLNVRLEASDLSRKTLFLAGVPDAVLRQNPESPPDQIPAPWLGAFDAWANVLNTAAWGFTGRSITAGEGIVPRQVVGSATEVGTNNVQLIITTPAPQFTIAQQVQLRGFKMLNKAYTPAQGIFAVGNVEQDAPIAGQTRLTLRSSSAIDVATIKDFGTVEKVDYQFRKYVRVQMQRQTTRKRGNRTLSGPGRRTTRERI